MSGSDIASVLDKNSTEKFFIEYNGFLSNHLTHGVIALHRLGVPSERIERFIQWYSPKLESTTSDVIDDRPVEELKGKRVAYYSILKHFEHLLREKYKTVDDLIKNEYPHVSNGLAGSALHGTIHLGYGYSVRNERIILEGLAYTFHSYRPIVTTKSNADLAVFGSGNVEIMDVLRSLRLNKELFNKMKEGIKEDRWKPLKLGNFQLSVCYLLTDHGDLLTNLVLSLALGQYVRASDSSLDPVKLGRRIVYLSVLVYALAEDRNNFFLLHGVTCAWGLHQIMPLLTAEDGIKVVREFLTVLLAVYVAEGSPDMNVPLSLGQFKDKDWSQLIDRAVEVDRDEHCYKLVQVCNEMAKNAVENDEDPDVYVQAAKSAIDYDLYLFKIFG
ncbi:uncharacterized protein LOC123529487 isoform X2 [Mercenaria mercenaria]|nr:uncharacterized protein LOC123529487 isoform X2 [Mercenaria mercenaria]